MQTFEFLALLLVALVAAALGFVLAVLVVARKLQAVRQEAHETSLALVAAEQARAAEQAQQDYRAHELQELQHTVREQRDRLEHEQQQQAQLAQQLALSQEQVRGLESRQHEAAKQLATRQEEVIALRDQQQRAVLQHAAQEQETAAQVARLRQELFDSKQAHADQLQILEHAKETLTHQFQALAAQALQQNTDAASKQHVERLGAVLTPLQDRLQAFEAQVKTAYDQETRERISLQEQLKNLMSTNARLGDEAAQLARALTGQAKTRGDWGEQILEQLLQHAGLRRGHEYRTQVTGTTAEGDRLQPDIVVDLPDKKHVIIDSKLSLIPWIAVSEAPHDEARHSALKALHVAVREHLKQLSLKNYEHLFDLVSVDFVLMFIPIEGAFAEVVGTDPTIYQEALDKNVVIVSPTTLLATLRTIAAIWRYDRQEQHAFKIAEAAGKMYDQFVLYTEVLNKVGERLDQAQDAFEQARSRLSDGRGNLIRRAQIVKELGAKAAKRFDQSVTALAGDDFVALLGENDVLPDADTDADSNANNAGMNDAHPV